MQTATIGLSPERQDGFDLKNLTIAFLVLFAVTSAIGITPMQAAYSIAFAFWLALLLVTRGKEGWYPNPLLRAVLLLVLVNLVVMFFSIDPAASLRGIKQLTLVTMILVVGSTVTRKEEVQFLVTAWMAAAGVVGLYAVGQYLHGIPRVHGLFGGPATLLRVLLLVGIIALALLISGKKRRLRVLAGCCFTVTAVAVFLTFMRGGWLALFTAVAVLGVILRSRLIAAMVLAAVLLAVGLGLVSPQSGTGSLIRSMVRPLDPGSARFAGSNLQKYWKYRSAIGIFCDHPLVGVGQRNYSKAYPDYIPENLRNPHELTHDGTVYTGFTDAHNLYLNLLATQGGLGLAAFLYLVLAAGRLAWHSYRHQQDPFLRSLSAGILAAFAAFLALGLTNENSRDSESIMQLWFLMGITVAIHRMSPDQTIGTNQTGGRLEAASPSGDLAPEAASG